MTEDANQKIGQTYGKLLTSLVKDFHLSSKEAAAIVARVLKWYDEE